MFQEFRVVRLQDTSDVDYLLTPEKAIAPLNLHSPAMELLTDFTLVPPVIIQESVPVTEALEYMKSQHVRLLFVKDLHDDFSGIISAADIMGRKVMAFMQRDGVSRDQVQVRHIMLNKLQIKALTFQQLNDVRIGDIVQTLKGSGEQHIVILDISTAGVKRIRGVISASDISRKLKIGFEVMYEAKSFSDIERIVSRGHEP